MKLLSISKRIISGFCFIFLLCSLAVGFSVYYLLELRDSINYLKGNYSFAMTNSQDLMYNTHMGILYLFESIASAGNGNAKHDNVDANAFNNALNAIDGNIDSIGNSIADPFLKGSGDLNAYKLKLSEARDELLNLSSDFEEAKFIVGEKDKEEAIRSIFNKGTELMKISTDLCNGIGDKTRTKIQKRIDSIFTVLNYLGFFVALILILFTIYFTVFVSSGISKPLEKIIKSMAEAERGRLDTRLIFEEHSDEFQSVAESFNHMLEGICEMIAKVLETSDSLATNSQQLSSASVESAATLLDISKNVNDINKSSLEISDNLEKTTDSVENFSESAQKVASLAATAVEAANVTTQVAESGGKTVKKSVDMIGKIKESVDIATQVILDLNSASLQINEIVNTITAIASQTNLLALNAAIEAARAGEQGKGFTVVADEVRKLAEESAEAAEAIGTRIENILTKTQNAADSMTLGRGRVDDGIRIIREVSNSLDQIIENVNDVNKKISDISSISSAQSENSLIMAKTIEDITTLTKNTTERLGVVATSVEQQTTTVSQISNSTEDLASLADELHLLVSRFTINKTA